MKFVAVQTLCVSGCLQILQWVFAGAPGHPALREACDFIAQHAHTVFSNNTNQVRCASRTSDPQPSGTPAVFLHTSY